jgi:hypothetical protein
MSKYYTWCLLCVCHVLCLLYVFFSMFSIFSMCSIWSFTPVPLFPFTTLGSNQSIIFFRFAVVLIFRGDVALMIILKQGYIMHISNTQRKYASSVNSVSRTLHLHILFHQQFALHIWSTVSAPLSRPTLQFNGRPPANDNIERHIWDTGWLKILTLVWKNIFNTLSTELNPICHLLALGARHILHVSRIRVNKTHQVGATWPLSQHNQLHFKLLPASCDLPSSSSWQTFHQEANKCVVSKAHY